MIYKHLESIHKRAARSRLQHWSQRIAHIYPRITCLRVVVIVTGACTQISGREVSEKRNFDEKLLSRKVRFILRNRVNDDTTRKYHREARCSVLSESERYSSKGGLCGTMYDVEQTSPEIRVLAYFRESYPQRFFRCIDEFQVWDFSRRHQLHLKGQTCTAVIPCLGSFLRLLYGILMDSEKYYLDMCLGPGPTRLFIRLILVVHKRLEFGPSME